MDTIARANARLGTRISAQMACSIAMAALMIGISALPIGAFAAPQDRMPQTWVIMAAGDFTGTHLPGNNAQRHQYDDVADLISSVNPTAFLALGDLQHEDGVLEDYLTYYDSQFGDLRGISYPVPGNHDYYWDGYPENNWHSASNGSGYFGYFETRLAEISSDPNTLLYGYYSFDLGRAWHIIALNSPLVYDFDPMEPGTPTNTQYNWLVNDLKEHASFQGTIVFFHHPNYDWETPNSPQWSSPELQPYWDLFYANGVDLVLNGHAHNYQRWQPQDAYGNYMADGVREFIVGTGGYYLNNLGHNPVPTNFVTGEDQSFGALKLTLSMGGYSFEFVSISGRVMDSGAFPCN